MKNIFTIKVETIQRKPYVTGYINNKLATKLPITDKKDINNLKEQTRIRLLNIIAKTNSKETKTDPAISARRSGSKKHEHRLRPKLQEIEYAV